MLLKKIELYNFRQFEGKQIIEFSTDLDKNITLIKGENGAGKTSLAQAFHWVLYGTNGFKDKVLINSNVYGGLKPNQIAKTKVSLFLERNDKEYIITRTASYKRKADGVTAKSEENTFHYYEIINGNQKSHTEIESRNFVQEMLPKELSSFFVFDGERIRILSEEIDSGKSKQFADAVRGLVGLTAMQNTINHFKPSHGRNTVIGRFNKNIDEEGTKKTAAYTEKIRELQKEIDSHKIRLSEITTEKDSYKKHIENKQNQLETLMPMMASKQEYEQNIRKRNAQQKERVKTISSLFKYFSINSPGFFAMPLSQSVGTELIETKSAEKSLPDIQQRTIKILLDRGTCICGTPLKEGTKEYETLVELMDYLPPKSIGSSIRQFATESKSNVRNSSGFYQTFNDFIQKLADIDEEIDQLNTRNDELIKTIDEGNKGEEIQAQIKKYNINLDALDSEENALISKCSSLENYRKQAEAKREELININIKSKKSLEYRAYAQVVFEKLSKIYEIHERNTRIELEKTINKIFEEIYDGGMKINVDGNYKIKVDVLMDHSRSDDLERSTAQNYSIIFAFISGIIEMAKKKSADLRNGEVVESEDLDIFDESEGYPLIMDAPLSAFDKKRIHNICEILPNVAQQVIIFIKDTDGDVAEEHMHDRIGQEYLIKKYSLTRSSIQEAQNV